MYKLLDLLQSLKHSIYFEKKKVDPKLCFMLNNQTLLVIEMHKKHPKYIIDKIIQVALPDSLFENNQLVDDDTFSKTLKQLCTEHQLHAKNVIFIGDNSNILMRIITVPKSDVKGISDYIHKQLSYYTLFAGHELYKNWKILDTLNINQEPYYRVMVLTCKSDTFNRWHNIMKQAQLSLFGISSHTAGLIHQFLNNDDGEDKIIICAEKEQTSYMAWTDNTLQNIHYDPTPLSALISTENTNEKTDIITHLLHSQNKNSRIYFYAPFLEKKHKEALEPLMQKINAVFLPVSPFLANCKISESYDHLIRKTLPAIGAGKMTEEDLLIVDLTHGTPYLKVLLTYFLISSVITAFVMLSIFFIFYYQSKGLNKEIQVVKNELNHTSKEFEVVRKIDNNINLMKQLIITRRKLKTDNPNFNAEHFYANLSTLMNNDTRIRSFKVNKKGEIIIHGEAIQSDAVFKLLQNLKNSPLLDTVKLNEVEHNSGLNTVQFTITTQRGERQ